VNTRTAWAELHSGETSTDIFPGGGGYSSAQMEFMWARPGLLVPYIQHRAELRLQPISKQKRVGEMFEEAIQEVRAVSPSRRPSPRFACIASFPRAAVRDKQRQSQQEKVPTLIH